MSADVKSYADQLRQYATHFVFRDWDYTRDLDGLTSLRYNYPSDTLAGRIRSAFGWLTHKPAAWEKDLRVGRWAMARHVLRRDNHLPDGILDGGSIITIWEETGEYLQYVQPTVGEMLADWMDDEPDSPHAQRIADEMKRINDRYSQRIATKGGAA